MALENGKDVLISGFGKSFVKEKHERRRRNPATGDDMMLRSRRVVTLKCSPVLTPHFPRAQILFGFVTPFRLWEHILVEPFE